jgi:hypothetical protein
MNKEYQFPKKKIKNKIPSSITLNVRDAINKFNLIKN